jgi:hypothetical protein
VSAPSRRTFVNAAAILGVGLFALGGVSMIPSLRDLEREMVKAIALHLDPAESAFSGNGSEERPWRRWKAKPAVVPEPVRLLSIDDDPERYFSSAPPSPVDCALIFSSLRETGHTTVGCGYLMAWDEAEPLAVLALRKQLDRLDAAVLGLPLARSAAGEPLPAAFLRLSMDAGEIDGDYSSLPQVNRVAVPNAELGGERTLAGFTLLENERDAGDGRRHLLARWGDRIIFSLPLATEIAALKIDPAEVRILAGKEIRLGTGGPVIPIDEFGRTLVATDAEPADTPAWKLVSEDNPLPPAQDPLLIRDHRTELPEADRAWSEGLAGFAHALRAAPRYEKSVLLPRPDALAEIGLLGLIVLFSTWAASLDRFGWRLLVVLMAVAFSAELVYLLASRQNLWLPPFAVAVVGVTSLVLSFIPEAPPVSRAEIPTPAVPAETPAVVAPIATPPVAVPVPTPIVVAPASILTVATPAPPPAPVAIPVPIPDPAFVSVHIMQTPEGLTRVMISPRPPVPEVPLRETSPAAITAPPVPPPSPEPPSSGKGSPSKSSKKSRRKRRR